MASADIIPAWSGVGEDSDFSAWWTCQIGDFILPGIATCEGFDRAQDVDIKKSKGQDGATLEDNGRVPAEGRVTIEITALQWPTAFKILQSLDPQKKGAVREPREFVHPLPNAQGVTQIYVRKISMSPPTAAGGMTITLDCVEWCPQPKPTKVKKTVAATSPSSVSFGDGPDAQLKLRAWELTQASNDKVFSDSHDIDESTFEDNTNPLAQRRGG